MNKIRRGDIFYADLNPTVGSEQGGVRPIVVIQNDTGNHHSPTVIVSAITSKQKCRLPTHTSLFEYPQLESSSIALLEQIRTIDKRRLGSHICTLEDRRMLDVNRALAISLGLER